MDFKKSCVAIIFHLKSNKAKKSTTPRYAYLKFRHLFYYEAFLLTLKIPSSVLFVLKSNRLWSKK